MAKVIKVLLVGASGTGKVSLAARTVVECLWVPCQTSLRGQASDFVVCAARVFPADINWVTYSTFLGYSPKATERLLEQISLLGRCLLRHIQ